MPPPPVGRDIGKSRSAFSTLVGLGLQIFRRLGLDYRTQAAVKSAIS
jgi:hypothetical protein